MQVILEYECLHKSTALTPVFSDLDWQGPGYLGQTIGNLG